VQGEVRHFVREIETKKGDREVNDTFEILQKTTELADFELDNLKAQCDSVLPGVKANLLLAQSMAEKILSRDSKSEIEQALASSKTSRDKEWEAFKADIEDRRAKVDEAYQERERDLRRHFQNLETQLGEDQVGGGQ